MRTRAQSVGLGLLLLTVGFGGGCKDKAGSGPSDNQKLLRSHLR